MLFVQFVFIISSFFCLSLVLFILFVRAKRTKQEKHAAVGDLAKIGAARAKAAELAPSGLRHRCFLTPLRPRFFNANPLKAESQH